MLYSCTLDAVCRVRALACVRARVHAGVRVCVSSRVRVSVCVCARVRARVRVRCMRAHA